MRKNLYVPNWLRIPKSGLLIIVAFERAEKDQPEKKLSYRERGLVDAIIQSFEDLDYLIKRGNMIFRTEKKFNVIYS